MRRRRDRWMRERERDAHDAKYKPGSILSHATYLLAGGPKMWAQNELDDKEWRQDNRSTKAVMKRIVLLLNQQIDEMEAVIDQAKEEIRHL